jgi:hypothetical protein
MELARDKMGAAGAVVSAADAPKSNNSNAPSSTRPCIAHALHAETRYVLAKQPLKTAHAFRDFNL